MPIVSHRPTSFQRLLRSYNNSSFVTQQRARLIIERMKVIGVGLNKTGTKTLRACLIHWGYKHITYNLDAFHLYQRQDWRALRSLSDQYDSCEDWPWPLAYQQFDDWYPDAKFVLTTRSSAEKWYKSLCKMAARLGPMNDFEKHIYGYAMPHGRREAHLRYYERHNAAVRAHFADRPNKLLEFCWERGDGWAQLADFLGHEAPSEPIPYQNKTTPYVYKGDNLALAYLYNGGYRAYQRVKPLLNR